MIARRVATSETRSGGGEGWASVSTSFRHDVHLLPPLRVLLQPSFALFSPVCNFGGTRDA
jgi:hypothetical protein